MIQILHAQNNGIGILHAGTQYRFRRSMAERLRTNTYRKYYSCVGDGWQEMIAPK